MFGYLPAPSILCRNKYHSPTEIRNQYTVIIGNHVINCLSNFFEWNVWFHVSHNKFLNKFELYGDELTSNTHIQSNYKQKIKIIGSYIYVDYSVLVKAHNELLLMRSHSKGHPLFDCFSSFELTSFTFADIHYCLFTAFRNIFNCQWNAIEVWGVWQSKIGKKQQP